MSKRDLINFLFILSFPMYGIGTYVSASKSPSLGYMVSISPHFLIFLFYTIDLLYKKKFRVRLNGMYVLMMVYIASTIVSLFIAFNNDLPESTFMIMLTKSLLILTPFNGFIVVMLYNRDNESQIPRLTILSLSLLLTINLLGYFGLGLTNEIHSLEGRLNFPFLDGLYSGASLLAIINLLLIYYLKSAWTHPIRFVSLCAYFTLNLALFFMINSRLATMILLFILTLTLFRAIRMKGLYVLSMFTIPILLSSGLILYKIIQLPGFSSLMQRVDVEDVTTFNGRSYIWEDAMDWLTKSQEGLFLGNGYKGHYFLDLISDVAKMWNVKDIYHLHLHSSSLEVLVCQGIIFFAVFAVILYKIYSYYKKKHKMGLEQGAFFVVAVYLLFILQVDTFVYDDGLGFVIFALLVSQLAVSYKVSLKAGIKLDKYNAIFNSDKIPLAQNNLLANRI